MQTKKCEHDFDFLVESCGILLHFSECQIFFSSRKSFMVKDLLITGSTVGTLVVGRIANKTAFSRKKKVQLIES